MKKITLLATVLFAFASTAHAAGIINFSGGVAENRFDFDDPIVFTERGIEFYIFPNGEFDFNTVETAGSGTVYKQGRRNTNTTYGVPAGIRIEHDAAGRIRRIGNVFMNCDHENRIKRIGSVYMTYNRFALTQVGNLKILYNRNGQIVNIIGNVKYETPTRTYAYNSGNQYGNSNNTYYKTGSGN